MFEADPQFVNGATYMATSMLERAIQSRKDLIPLPIVQDILCS